MTKNKKAAIRLLFIRGKADAKAGVPARRRNEHYNRGYSCQYTFEQVIDSRCIYDALSST